LGLGASCQQEKAGESFGRVEHCDEIVQRPNIYYKSKGKRAEIMEKRSFIQEMGTVKTY
jgi:hypothetical protein